MIGLVFLWTVGFLFADMFQCIPISVNWTDWGYEEGKCIDVNRMMIAQAWSDVATNLIILLLPLGCVGIARPLGSWACADEFVDIRASNAILEKGRRSCGISPRCLVSVHILSHIFLTNFKTERWGLVSQSLWFTTTYLMVSMES